MNESINKREDGIEVDMQELLLSYLHHWYLILISAVVIAGLALGYTRLFVTPLYRSSVTIYVNNSKNNEQVEYITTTNLSASERLVSTYINIIQSDSVLQKVVEAAELNCSPAYVRNIMTASQVKSTEIFKVFISNEDPEMAAHIANAIAEVAPGEITNIVEGSSTKIIDYAKVSSEPYTPSYQKNGVVGAAIGCVLAVVYITLKFLMDVRINDSQDLEQLFEYPVLGQIPSFEQDTAKKHRYGYKKYGYHNYGYSKYGYSQANAENEK